MARVTKYGPLLVALGLLAYAVVRVLAYAGEPPWSPLPVSHRVMLFSWYWDVLAFVAAALGPLPLCLCTCLFLRKRRGALDAADIAVTHAVTAVCVQSVVFALFLGLHAGSPRAFCRLELTVFLSGCALLRWLIWRYPTALTWRATVGVLLGYAAVAGVLCAGGLLSVHFRQETTCDLHAYHYYNVYSWLNHRLHFDYVVADQQTFFNPLADVPFYFLVQSLRPIWVGFVQGAMHFLPGVLLFGLAYKVLGLTGSSGSFRFALALACAVAGCYEPVNVAELGTTLNDNLLTSFVLGALLLLVGALGQAKTPRGRLLLAGVLIGLVTGLKLTFASCGVAAIVAVPLVGSSWRQRLTGTAWFAVGSLAGFVAADGYWAATLYREFANPLYPFYNAWFQSPYSWPININVTLQVPHGRREFLFYPFYFLRPQARAMEFWFQDYRLAIVYVLLVLVALGKLLRPAWARLVRAAGLVSAGRTAGASPAARQVFATLGSVIARWRRTVTAGPELPGASTAPLVFLLLFCLVTYVVWLVQFHILRYLCPVQMLAPLLAVLLLTTMLGQRVRGFLAASLVCFLVVAGAEVAHLDRKWWAMSYFEVEVPAIEETHDAIVLVTWEVAPSTIYPFGFVLPSLPPELRFVRLDSSLLDQKGKMYDEVRELLRQHTGPFYLLTHGPTSFVAQRGTLDLAVQRLHEHGLCLKKDDYQSVKAFGRDLGLWRVFRVPEPDSLREPASTVPGVE